MKNTKILEAEIMEYDLDRREHKLIYDTMLDECEGQVEICGMKYDASDVLESVDPIAYRCGFNDYMGSLDTTYLCPICKKEYSDDQDSAQWCCQSPIEDDHEAD